MARKVANKKALDNNTSAMGPDLILAAERGDLYGIRDAVLSGTSVNYQEDRTGITALHAASARGHLSAVKLLLAHPDIDPQLLDNFGRDALLVAMKTPYDEVIEVLFTATFPEEEPPTDPSDQAQDGGNVVKARFGQGDPEP